jgi:hypothetical protein
MPNPFAKPISDAAKAPPRPERARRGEDFVDLQRVNVRLLNELERESASLLNAAHHGKLTRDESTALKDYLRLMKDLLKKDADAAEELPDSELAKIAAKDKAK